jgi:hypothetical protein
MELVRKSRRERWHRLRRKSSAAWRKFSVELGRRVIFTFVACVDYVINVIRGGLSGNRTDGKVMARSIANCPSKTRWERVKLALVDERGDVPGWVLVVLMTTGLVTAIWAVAAPRLNSILKNSLDSMNGIR